MYHCPDAFFGEGYSRSIYIIDPYAINRSAHRRFIIDGCVRSECFVPLPVRIREPPGSAKSSRKSRGELMGAIKNNPQKKFERMIRAKFVFAAILLAWLFIFLAIKGVGNKKILRDDIEPLDLIGEGAGHVSKKKEIIDADFGLAFASETPIKSYIEHQQKKMNGGDSRSVCAIAWALDYCMNGNYEKSSKYEFLFRDDLEGKSEDALLEIEQALSLTDAAERSCRGINDFEHNNYYRLMLRSAANGDKKSMSRISLMPQRLGFDASNVDSDLVKVINGSAEAFLNKAALAGDKDALVGVYRSYATGRIDNAFGIIKIQKDKVKAAAAASVIALDAEYQDYKHLLDFVSASKSSMSSAELMNFNQLRKTYISSHMKNKEIRTYDGSNDAYGILDACRYF